jgi:hypothetical protein
VGVRGSAIAVPAGDNFPSDQAAGSHIDAWYERKELLESLTESETKTTRYFHKVHYSISNYLIRRLKKKNVIMYLNYNIIVKRVEF